jgi:hypothetical protein
MDTSKPATQAELYSVAGSICVVVMFVAIPIPRWGDWFRLLAFANASVLASYYMVKAHRLRQ